jgi:hypothetical protein
MNGSVRLVQVAMWMLLGTSGIQPADRPHVAVDHVWIMVSPDAPERAALQRAGFLISPDVNHHDGQGTSSITVELRNAYLELIWPDSGVKTDPGLERAVEKFRNRMMWRTSGWSPIGIGLHRTTQANEPFPFPTWSTAAAWMPPGSAMEMLTPRDDTKSPALFISPVSSSDAAEQAKRGALYHHPIGVQQITALRLVSPTTYQPIPPLTWLQKQGVVSLGAGDAWLLELTFDGGRQNKSKDFRPELPLLVHY